MRRTRVRDVMTSDVVSVVATTPYKAIVRALALRQISGVPVVDGNRRPIGIVSETDLLAKEAHPGACVERPLLEGPRHRAERRRAAADDAGSLMSTGPVTITADAPTTEAARRMRRHQVNRLPVVDHRGKLIGIVSRGDVLRAFLGSDEGIRRRVRDEVLRHDWQLEPSGFLVDVHDGVVTIRGELEREGMVAPLCRDLASIDGVVRVDGQLTWRRSERDARRLSAAMLPR